MLYSITNKIILFSIILGVYAETASPYSKEMTALFNGYYMGSVDIDMLVENALSSGASEIETQTYKNIVTVLKMRSSTESSRKLYNMLKSTLEENEPLLSETDPNYMTSVADLMFALIEYSGSSDIIKLSAEGDELYEEVLKINPNHFGALIGQGIATSFRPKFVGGGVDKGMPLFKKAEINAKENWEKHLVYIWLSQANMTMGNDANYKKYVTLAENIYKDSYFLNMVKKMNAENKSMFGKKYY